MRTFTTFFTNDIPDSNYNCEFDIFSRLDNELYGEATLTASDVEFSIKFKWSAEVNEDTGEIENIQRDENQEIEYEFDEDQILIYCYVENKFIDRPSHKQEEFVTQAADSTTLGHSAHDHLDTRSMLTWTPDPRPLGQAVGAQRRRFALLV